MGVVEMAWEDGKDAKDGCRSKMKEEKQKEKRCLMD